MDGLEAREGGVVTRTLKFRRTSPVFVFAPARGRKCSIQLSVWVRLMVQTRWAGGG